MKQLLKFKIVELRKSGYSYNDIQLKLGCSKGTISYYCGDNQKEKKNIRQRKRRSSSVIKSKVEAFCCRSYSGTEAYAEDRHFLKILNIKIRFFSMDRKTKKTKQLFKAQDLLNKIGENPVCYLTGRPINLEDGRSYHLDHIIPISKGGNNSLDNCGLACKEANQSKHSLTKDEFIRLCQDVVDNHIKDMGSTKQ
jgi:5-methylcytosine-specific restriction endonuclease McrA